MLSSDVLEIGIGLALVFLFVSLIATAVREIIESWMKTRASDLERGIRELLNDPSGSTITKSLFDHPQIFSLFQGAYKPETLKPAAESDAGTASNMPWSERKNLPSYIPAANFANALIDIVARGAVQAAPGSAGAAEPLTIEGLRAKVATLPNERLQRAVLSAIDMAENDINKVKANLETWFNSTMDRVSGWYKRRTQKILFGIGVAMALLLNVDAVHITKRLATDKSMREALVKQADKIVTPSPATATKDGNAATTPAEQDKRLTDLQAKSFTQLRGQLEQLGLPVGWSPMPQLQSCAKSDGAGASGCDIDLTCWVFIQMILGWLITALAVMLGAPFWFDVLNKFMTLRSSIKPQEKKPSADGKGGAPSDGDASGVSVLALPEARGKAATAVVSAATQAANAVATAAANAVQPPAPPPPNSFVAHAWAPTAGKANNDEGVI